MEDDARLTIFNEPVKDLYIGNALGEKSSFRIFKVMATNKDDVFYISRARIKPFVYVEIQGSTVDFVEEQTLLYLKTMGWCLM